ncbi:hypothetical protein VO64_5805 [Pseudomonas synxantha]|uniref:Uncharacterized protein n=1 Tax=Pseudomonas synxantha TaxID=47883 RepID=A0AAU8TZM3_9PSED|nr:hypothetical protein VO64_5805 [Pseudomonas synxantha]
MLGGLRGRRKLQRQSCVLPRLLLCGGHSLMLGNHHLPLLS